MISAEAGVVSGFLQHRKRTAQPPTAENWAEREDNRNEPEVTSQRGGISARLHEVTPPLGPVADATLARLILLSC
jgi:hypothetical protein